MAKGFSGRELRTLDPLTLDDMKMDTVLAFFAKHLKSDDRWWVEMYKPTALEK